MSFSKINDKSLLFGFDIETDYFADTDRVDIVQYALVNDSECIEIYGRSVEDFFMQIEKIYKKYRRTLWIFAHNGAKFDYDFLNDYTYDKYGKNWDTLYNGRQLVCAKLLDVQDKDSKNDIKTIAVFLDTIKFFQTTLEVCGKYFNCPKLEGFSFIDGWSKNVDFSNPENWKYVINDARIAYKMAEFIYIQNKCTSYTASSMAIKEFTNMLPQIKGVTAPQQKFKKYFIDIGNKEYNEIIRKCCYGGHIECYQKGDFRNVYEYDINSAYTNACKEIDFPIGRPYAANFLSLDIQKNVWFGKFRIKMSLKKGYLPTYHVKIKEYREIEGLKPAESLIKNKKYMIVYWSCWDYKNYSRNYNIEFDKKFDGQRIVFYKAGKIGIDFADKFFNLKNEEKKKGNKAQELFYKLYPNGFSGRTKFSQKPQYSLSRHLTKNIVMPISTGIVDDKDVSFVAPQIYAIITSYSRYLLNTAMLKLDKEIISCHTDSIKSLKPIDSEYIDDFKLGKFKFEGLYHQYISIDTNRSIGIKNGVIETLRDFDNVKVTFSGFNAKYNISGVPASNEWYEILDRNTKLVDIETEIGNEHYCINTPSIRRLAKSQGLNADDIDTRIKYFIRYTGGRRCILKPKSLLLNNNFNIRI